MTNSKWFLCAAAALAVFSSATFAQELKLPERKGELWVNPGLLSYHFDRSKHYRDFNYGLGAEYLLSNNHALMAGIYKNSESETSRYVGYGWRPLHWQPYDLNVSAGLAAMLMDGYPTMNNRGAFIAAFPTLSVEGKKFGANFVLVPNVKHGGAVAVQFKLKAW